MNEARQFVLKARELLREYLGEFPEHDQADIRIFDANEQLWAALRLMPEEECDHDWVSADNEYVTGTEICLKCKSIRAKP